MCFYLLFFVFGIFLRDVLQLSTADKKETLATQDFVTSFGSNSLSVLDQLVAQSFLLSGFSLICASRMCVF